MYSNIIRVFYGCVEFEYDDDDDYELILPLLNMCDLVRVMICVKLLSITRCFIMLIISIEELTLTTIFQVTSSD